MAAADLSVVPAAAAANAGGGAMSPTLGGSPTFIEDKNQRFVICDSPTDHNLPAYIEYFKKKNVKSLVRAVEASYSTAPLIAAGIPVLDVPFADGDPPPAEVLNKFLGLVNSTFGIGSGAAAAATASAASEEKPAIAVHCLAGLGRGAVLVAVALVENGMEPLDAVAFIRKKRKSAINARQLTFIESYKPVRGGGIAGGCCVVS